MNLRRFLFLILFFIGCSNSQIENTVELATDSQRNWCYGTAYDIRIKGILGNPELVDLVNKFQGAYNLYAKETEKDLSRLEIFDWGEFQQELSDNTPGAMRLCKIWADMEDIN